ncbi:conserved hypothetical protein [Streptomyces sp. SPB074]|nr:conserved hypothetical protein [Streptomyces sp. SPB074]
MRLGPVVAGPERWAPLVAPYDLARLGALLHAMDRVPGALRFHGSGGYLVLPPSRTGAGTTGWARGPLPEAEPVGGAGAPEDAGTEGAGVRGGMARPWLPEVGTLLGPIVETLTRPGVNAPEF